MLHAIDESNLQQAFELLCEGFPNRSEQFWHTALGRITQTGGNKRADVPIGFLMGQAGAPTGIVLTPSSVRRTAAGVEQRVVNLSSWYVKKSDRWRAPMMMRQLLRMENAIFTDLTPTDSVKEMLKAFGFEKINRGVAVNFLPLARLRGRRGARLVSASGGQVDTAPMASATDQVVAEYQEFDCIVANLIHGEDRIPLVFKRVKSRKFPLAMLVYCEDNNAVYGNLAAIGRYLAKEGIYLLVLDIPPERRIPGIAREKRGQKFARGDWETNRTDFLGTELSLFDW